MKNIILKFVKSSQPHSDSTGQVNDETQIHKQQLDITYTVIQNDDYKPEETYHDYPQKAIEYYDQWKSIYEDFLESIDDTYKGNESFSGGEDAYTFDEVKRKVRQNFNRCVRELNNWFSGITLSNGQLLEKDIKDQLQSAKTKTKLIIQTEHEPIQKLFWHKLRLLTKNPDTTNKTGLIYGLPKLKSPSLVNTHNNTINHNLNILVIYGGEAKEEVEGNKEYKTLQEWENDFNQSHPNCPINVIECPNKFSDLIDKF